MKIGYRKSVLGTLGLALALSAATAHASVTSTAIERLCYVKAEDAPVTYKVEANRYRVSSKALRMLEDMPVCNGVKLGEVENNWLKRQAARKS